MTRPDLDAIRARNLVDWTGNGKEELSGDVAALLAYVEELERLNGVNNRIIVGLLSTIESMSTVDASYDDDEP